MRTFHFSGGRRAGKRLARALRLVQPSILDAPGVHSESTASEPSPTEYGSSAYSGLHGHSVVAGQRAPSIGDSLSGGTTQVSGWDPYRFGEIPIRTRDLQAEYWRIQSPASRSMVGLANGSTITFETEELYRRQQDQLNQLWQQQINRLTNPVWIQPMQEQYRVNLQYAISNQWITATNTAWLEEYDSPLIDPDLVMDVEL